MAGAYSIDPEFRDNLLKLSERSHRGYASRLAAGQEVVITATDHSMAPTVWPQDKMVFGFPDVKSIAADDIVLFRRQGKLLARRVLRRLEMDREDVVITRPDSGEGAEVSIGVTEVIGRLVFVERDGERIPVGNLGGGWVGRLLNLKRSPVLSRVSEWLEARKQG